MKVTDLSMFNESPKTTKVWHIQLCEDPHIFDEPKSLLISVPVMGFVQGSTNPNGSNRTEYAHTPDDAAGDEKVFYNTFTRYLRRVIDMRSIFFDLIATETITCSRNRWIRVRNERTEEYVKFRICYPEITEKQIQTLFSKFLRSGKDCQGNIKIGFPWQ